MKINILILCLLIAILGGWTAYKNNSAPPPVQTTSVPDFSYQTITGKTGNLYGHKGKMIILHFWATWCAPCLVELPTLIDLANNQKEIIVLAVAVKDTDKKVGRFIKKIKKQIPENFMIIQDTDKKISKNLFQTHKLPESFIINPDLFLSQKIIGAEENWNSKAWNNKIRDLQASP